MGELLSMLKLLITIVLIILHLGANLFKKKLLFLYKIMSCFINFLVNLIPHIDYLRLVN